MSHRTALADIAPYITRDGSEIRELLHPDLHAVRQQSLAEAVVPPGTATLLHRHARSEEIYHVTRGNGTMTLGDEVFAIAPGDSIVIAPGTPHRDREHRRRSAAHPVLLRPGVLARRHRAASLKMAVFWGRP